MGGKTRTTRPGSPPPGRDGDLRAVLAMLDYHRVVAVVGGRGSGRSAVLQAVADLYRVPCAVADPPRQVQRGDLVVLDDADLLGSRALTAALRRVLEADGRVLLSSRTATRLPPKAQVHRLRGLGPDAASVVLDAPRGVSSTLSDRLVDHVGGSPALLEMSRDILRSRRLRSSFSSVEQVLAKQVEEVYLHELSARVRKGAGLLVAAGGWLPGALDVRSLQAATEPLLAAGLAELVDGALEATPVLMVAELGEPTAKDMRLASAGLRERRPLARSMVRLAEAHLHRWLGDGELALEAAREAHRFARGALRTEVFARSMCRLASLASGKLAASASLACAIYRYAADRDADLARSTVQSLVDAGGLAVPDVYEARTFLAVLTLETVGPKDALPSLVRSADHAASGGDLYAEAQALLWQAWIHLLADAPSAASPLAERAARLAKRAEAPVLQGRALHCLSRADLTEGDLDSAGRRLQQALRLTRRHRLDDDQTVILDALADVAGRLGRPSEAAEHLDAADSILKRAENLPRKGNLAVTRAEIALRRGHVGDARRILAGADVQMTTVPWRRDVLAAEVALAAADYEGAAAALRAGVPHPSSARSWVRRRALVAGALLREGVDPGFETTDLEADDVARLVLARGRGEVDRASGLVDGLLETVADDDPGAEPLVVQEAIAVRLLQGRLEEAAELVARLRNRFAAVAASTGALLLLEGIEYLVRGQPEEGARRAARAHRSAMVLGHRRVALFALELLAACHLAMGRARGLRWILARGRRLAESTRSPTRLSRMAVLRLVVASRFGEKRDYEDVRTVLEGPDIIGAAFVRYLDGEREPGPLFGLAAALHALLTTGASGEKGWATGRPEVAVELTLDRERREVALAGGKHVSFARRRVLWRLLTELYDADGRAIDPPTLYSAAWELPFNQSRLNSLYVGVRRLRLLVEPDPSSPRIILAAGGGYHLDVRRVGVGDLSRRTPG